MNNTKLTHRQIYNKHNTRTPTTLNTTKPIHGQQTQTTLRNATHTHKNPQTLTQKNPKQQKH